MMTNKYQNLSIFFLRMTMGWMYFYAGITKVLDPAWSSSGYLKGAKTFAFLYQWMLDPNILPYIDFLNKWGLTLLGISLLLGIMVRLSSALGAGLMFLYYLPLLAGIYPNANSVLVDQHIIYIGVLLLLGVFRAGRIWGLEEWCSGLPICKRYPGIRALFG